MSNSWWWSVVVPLEKYLSIRGTVCVCVLVVVVVLLQEMRTSTSHGAQRRVGGTRGCGGGQQCIVNMYLHTYIQHCTVHSTDIYIHTALHIAHIHIIIYIMYIHSQNLNSVRLIHTYIHTIMYVACSTYSLDNIINNLLNKFTIQCRMIIYTLTY